MDEDKTVDEVIAEVNEMVEKAQIDLFNKGFDTIPHDSIIFNNKIIKKDEFMCKVTVAEVRNRSKRNKQKLKEVYKIMDKNRIRVKDIVGKVDLTTLPYNSLVAIAKIREFGNKKYGSRWVWREKSTSPDIYVQAMLRHLFKYTDPNESDIDEESGMHHLWHVGCGALFAIAILEDNKNKGE